MGVFLDKNEINVCSNCGTPLIFTFRWAYREKFCINCGRIGDVFMGDSVKLTSELKAKKKIIDKLWKNIYGSGYLLPVSDYTMNKCKKCKEERNHRLHLSKREIRNDKIAERILRGMRGAFGKYS